ncbi:hypothetical protein [Geodermatophilus sabuli]|uniref:hypothetical protein n=1 Tax=Geodermatophilus sabuli TaxID=1564158 RepID=UPI001559392B|nr:hypothetical protein [Geodermatophilus sabuli]MBB3086767.1 hypothetical protein [Geodermatophilus sabuli]
MAEEDDDWRQAQPPWPRRLPRHLRRRRPPGSGEDRTHVQAPDEGGDPVGEDPAG